MLDKEKNEVSRFDVFILVYPFVLHCAQPTDALSCRKDITTGQNVSLNVK